MAHAICEVIERDATALWHASGTEGRDERLRLDLTDPLCRRLLDDYARADVLAAVWNTTTDIGVPCFACEIVDGEAHAARAVEPSAGMGCHTSPAVALARALTEAAQSRLTRIASSRDDVPRIDYEVFRSPDVLSAVRAEYLDTPATVEYESITGFESNAFEEDVRWLISALTAVGIEESSPSISRTRTCAYLLYGSSSPGLEPPMRRPVTCRVRARRASRANSVAP